MLSATEKLVIIIMGVCVGGCGGNRNWAELLCLRCNLFARTQW